MSKRNIKNGFFKVIGIWPFNPKAMDGRTKPSEFYAIDHNKNTSDEDNEKNSNEAIYDTEGWGENGIVAKLINIATTTNDPTTTRINVDG